MIELSVVRELLRRKARDSVVYLLVNTGREVLGDRTKISIRR